MRVVLDDGTSIDLGATEATPTIGITDYSRRETDDFGVTTVVERGFSRRMSVKLGVPFVQADALQQRLAGLRATAALWVADDRFASLTVRGFYKDFDLDLAVPPLSYCTLTVEGLAETAAVADPGGDPAPDGATSTLRLLQPVIMTNSVLVASNVPEDDAPEWQAETTYQLGATVVKTSTHRVYESLRAANVGNDPAGISGLWLDVGPTNRWAMFDQALGTATSAASAIVVTLDAGTTGAVALLDVSAATVRVQATGYDHMLPAGAVAITFLDLPANAGQVTVTISGNGAVSVGTLLIGRVVPLGITEASPTAGITDFSKKVVDDFGEVTIVERAWAKRMSAKALIRTDALDLVANRIAAVRAQPSLWIGKAGVDSLTVYGFFKDFSIEVGKTVSKLSLTIEGLSKAAPVVPLAPGGSVAWPDVTDPTGTKPADNATVGAPPGSPVGNILAEEVARLILLNGKNLLGEILRGNALAALTDARTMLGEKTIGTVVGETREQQVADSRAFTQNFDFMGARNGTNEGWIFNTETIDLGAADGTLTKLSAMVATINGHELSWQDLREIFYDESGEGLRSLMTMTRDGAITGIVNTLTGEVGDLLFLANRLRAVSTSGGQSTQIFGYGDDGVLEIPNARIKNLDVGVVKIANMAAGFSNAMRFSHADTPIGPTEVTLLETDLFDVGDSLQNGSALATFNMTHDGTAVVDAAATLRVYADLGQGYAPPVYSTLSGTQTSSGNTRWSSPLSFTTSLSAMGKARLKLTGQGYSLGGGPTSGSVARNVTVDILKIGR